MDMAEPVGSRARRGFVRNALAALAALVTRPGGVAAGQAPPRCRPAQIGRRVVTGVDPQGHSRIDTEAPLPASATWNDDGAKGMDFWAVRQVPARLDGAIEPPADWQLSNRAPAGGILGRLITCPPASSTPRTRLQPSTWASSCRAGCN